MNFVYGTYNTENAESDGACKRHELLALVKCLSGEGVDSCAEVFASTVNSYRANDRLIPSVSVNQPCLLMRHTVPLSPFSLSALLLAS